MLSYPEVREGGVMYCFDHLNGVDEVLDIYFHVKNLHYIFTFLIHILRYNIRYQEKRSGITSAKFAVGVRKT